MRDEDIATRMGGGSVRGVDLSLPYYPLADQRSDWEKVQAGNLQERGIDVPSQDSGALEALSQTLQDERLARGRPCEGDRLLWVVPKSESARYGFAIDLGTTTVDIALLNLETGERLARKAFLNGQVAFGADVVSRAQSFHDDRRSVRAAASNTIADGAAQILAETGIAARAVVKTVVVGNPIMVHILNDIDPYQLTQVPYIPVMNGSMRSSPAFYGWSFQSHGYVETLPLISAYVGADTIAMIVALDLEREPGPRCPSNRNERGDGARAARKDARHLDRRGPRLRRGADLVRHARAPGRDRRRVHCRFRRRESLRGRRCLAARHLRHRAHQRHRRASERGVIDTTGRIVEPEDGWRPAPRKTFHVGTSRRSPSLRIGPCISRKPTCASSSSPKAPFARASRHCWK